MGEWIANRIHHENTDNQQGNEELASAGDIGGGLNVFGPHQLPTSQQGTPKFRGGQEEPAKVQRTFSPMGQPDIIVPSEARKHKTC